ncbi:hypothetical protein C1X61_29225 [Pseudomonas sp. FW215-T2]|nr:hypothetical protein C1X61_29225 [Pseudomonas sp. FW215-T2]PNA05918.1 hypothetical protein C1X62_28825 [Pseudomonas sp. FW215-R3]PNB32760.1 hypothetical protein C1X63_29340 [Pseudomonas sp. FW305-131]
MDANDNAGHLNHRVVQSFSRASSLLHGSIPMMTGRLPSLALPSGAARAYLRGEWTASHLHFKRLRASVSAKQNGFWQIVH